MLKDISLFLRKPKDMGILCLFSLLFIQLFFFVGSSYAFTDYGETKPDPQKITNFTNSELQWCSTRFNGVSFTWNKPLLTGGSWKTDRDNADYNDYVNHCIDKQSKTLEEFDSSAKRACFSYIGSPDKTAREAGSFISVCKDPSVQQSINEIIQAETTQFQKFFCAKAVNQLLTECREQVLNPAIIAYEQCRSSFNIAKYWAGIGEGNRNSSIDIASCMTNKGVATERIKLQSLIEDNWEVSKEKIGNIREDINDKSTCQQKGLTWNYDKKTCSQEKAEASTSCVVNGIGWIVCTFSRFFAGVIDGVFQLLEGLMVIPAISTDTSSGLYKAWDILRSIANVMFVIVFMIVIYSQITGGSLSALSNYSVKRMLPRLIIAAILVNISYWLSAILVDLSNVAGAALYELLKDITNTIRSSNISWESMVGALLAGGTIAVTGAGALAATAVAGAVAGTSALVYLVIPAVLAGAIAVVLGFVTVALRQALVVMLIIISPLAFVAYILPNTNQYFVRWRKTMTTMLLFYPLFALVFGGSSLASVILINTAGSMEGRDAVVVGGALMITGMLVQVLPLFAAPWIMKSSGGIINGVTNRLNSLANPMRSEVGKWAKDKRETANARSLANGVGGGRFNLLNRGLNRTAKWGDRRRTKRGLQKAMYDSKIAADKEEWVSSDAESMGAIISKRVQDDRAGSIKTAQNQLYANALLADDDTLAAENPKLAKELQGQYGKGNLAAIAGGNLEYGEQKARAGAIAAQQSEFAKAVQNIQSTASFAPGDIGALGRAFEDAIQKGDKASARAYQNIMYGSGAPGLEAWQKSINSLEQSGGISAEMREDQQQNILANHGGIKAQNAAAMSWATDGSDGTLQSKIDNSETWSKLTDVEFISQKPFAQQAALQQNAISAERAQKILSNNNAGAMSEGVINDLRKLSQSAPKTMSEGRDEKIDNRGYL